MNKREREKGNWSCKWENRGKSKKLDRGKWNKTAGKKS